MKKLPAALLLTSCALASAAADCMRVAQVIRHEVAVKPGRKIALAVDGGRLIVNASESKGLTYRVEFIPDKRGFFDFFTKGPTQKDYDECAAVYTAEQGLKVHAGKGLSAVVTVGAPAGSAIDAQLSAGILTIGPRAGKVEAFIGDGILEYDASGLPAGVCVTASINAGTVANKRDFNCASVGAVLHGHSGIITVK